MGITADPHLLFAFKQFVCFWCGGIIQFNKKLFGTCTILWEIESIMQVLCL